jgi:hypothetical protein
MDIIPFDLEKWKINGLVIPWAAPKAVVASCGRVTLSARLNQQLTQEVLAMDQWI